MDTVLELFDEYKQIGENVKSTYDANKSLSREIYKGKKLGNEVEGRSKFVYKLAKKQVLSLVSNLIRPFIKTKKIISIIPANKNEIYKSKIIESILNNLWETDTRRIKNIKRVIKRAIIDGTCFVKVEFIENNKYKVIETKNPVLMNIYINKGYEKIEQFKFRKLVSSTKKPRFFVVDNVYVDDVLDIQDGRFVIAKLKLTKNDIKRIEYKNIYEKLNSIFEKYNIDDYIEIYEFYYKDGDDIRKAIISDYDNREVLADEEYKFSLFPFATMSVDYTDNLVGEGLPLLVEDEQKLITGVARGIIDNIASANADTIFVRKGALDNQNRINLLNKSRLVEVNTRDSINASIMFSNFNQIPQTLIGFMEFIERQSESLSGINRYMQGLSGSEINSPASNFKVFTSQSQVRLSDYADSFIDFLNQLFFIYIDYIAKTYSINDVRVISGIDIETAMQTEIEKQKQRFEIDNLPEDVKEKAEKIIKDEVYEMFNLGNLKMFDIHIKVSTDGIKTQKIQNLLMLIQNTASLVTSGALSVDALKLIIAELADNLDRPDIADIILTDDVPQNLFAQQMQMLEFELKKAEIDIKKGEAQKAFALAQNALARAEKEKAKATKEAGTIDADVAKKYTDLAKDFSEISNKDELKQKDINGTKKNKL